MKRFLFSGLVVTAWLLPALPLAAQGFSPEDSVRRMKVADGFRVRLIAAEPVIRQPLSLEFDDRGRLWVIQYLQYPTPAGLKPVKVDQYLRTTYDRVPAPPPHGPKGADRITILEDPDANGRFRKAKDFVTGLNLASGMVVGHGGIYVTQPPYLLFYPDRNGDDVPDGDPEVLLTGFGLQDAHALANSLQWGPDGWLYGAQGSTVTAHIRGLEFQQGIWRYHPITKEFELFAEGGGNTWGLDFDRHGNLIAGTNWGDKTCLHQVQGGYYIKGFGKHGPLHNPHTYGYFDHVPYTGFRGGHVTCGGIVYQGGTYPDSFRDCYIAANPLANAVYWHVFERQGSSFRSHFGGELLLGNDTWFRPIDCLTGPDGAVYIADWYDKRINHVDPVDNWDRSNGRVYRIEPTNPRPLPGPRLGNGLALGKLSSHELVGLLDHPNDWYVHTARRLLAERRDPAVIPELRQMVLDNKGQLALEALWALYVSGGFDDALAGKLLGHANEDVRTWTVRLLGDAKKVSPVIREQLVTLARTETSPVVRNQLACSSKRLPGRDGLPIVRELLKHAEDMTDPQIPLLLWWAIEDKAVSDCDEVIGLLDSAEAWRRPLVHRYIIERLGRRYMDEGNDAGLETCARLLAAAPGRDEADLLVRGMEQALQGRRLAHVPAALAEQLDRLRAQEPNNLTLTRLDVRMGRADAYGRVLRLVADPKVGEGERAGLADLLGQIGRADCVPVLLRVFGEARGDGLRGAVLAALQPFRDDRVTDTVLALYPKLSSGLRGRAETLLCSRPASARLFLQAVDAGRVPPKDVPLAQLQQMSRFHDETITRLLAKHWGKIGPATAGEKISRIRSVNLMLTRGHGNPANGRLLFQKNCATCHTLFGEGNKVGPDLTGADRKNREWLITQVVDPSSVIRQEYVAYNVTTTDGRVLTGLLAESTPQSVTLLDAKNQRTVLARDRIDEMTASPVSLMPEKILDPLDDQQICDLFSYLQGDGPKR
jgi:putative membrane-bound dehydrogenase-like protein